MVSFPLTWGEVEAAAGRGDPAALPVLSAEAVERAEKAGDLFHEVLVQQQKLPHL